MQYIAKLLDSSDFIDTHRKRPQDFTRQRHLDFKTTVLFLLNQPRAALQTELDLFFRVLQQAPFERRVVTAQALSKARATIKGWAPPLSVRSAEPGPATATRYL